MPNSMQPVGQSGGNPRVAEEGDFEDATLDSGRFVRVWSETATRKVLYWLGQGLEDQRANVGRIYLDAQNAVPGNIDGTARVVVYESDDHEFYKAIGPYFSLSDLRDAVTDDRTSRPMLAALNPGADEDEVIGLEIKAAAGSDGDTFTAANSDAHVPYSEIRR